MSQLERELYSQAPPPVADGDAAAEALWFVQQMRDGDVGPIRALIAVPPIVEDKLRAFAKSHPSDAEWVTRCLEYRRAVLEEFDKRTDAHLHAPPPAPLDPADQLLPVSSPTSETLELTAL